MTSAALLIMDIQQGVLARFTGDDGLPVAPWRGHSRGPRAGIPVMYVTGSFRPGHPEVSSRNTMFAAGAAAGRFVRGNPETCIHSAVAPEAGGIIITRYTGS
jgi:nicotinamidase-related amidase